MTELELILTEAGATLEWPDTPDLAGRVAARIRRPAGRAPRLRRPLVLALAALLILAAGAAAIPGVRHFLGFGSVRVERVTIDGAPGLWIHGALHQIVYEDRKGLIRPDTIRLAGDTLLWRRGPVLLRLEGARSRAEALRIAHSLRAAP